MDTVRAHVIVSGKVQGVCFRDATREAADELGVSGWVRNLSDGSVEAVFEGSAEQVERMIAYVNEGPPRAVVHHVAVQSESPLGESGRFMVRY